MPGTGLACSGKAQSLAQQLEEMIAGGAIKSCGTDDQCSIRTAWLLGVRQASQAR